MFKLFRYKKKYYFFKTPLILICYSTATIIATYELNRFNHGWHFYLGCGGR
jgi:hypothetical protein